MRNRLFGNADRSADFDTEFSSTSGVHTQHWKDWKEYSCLRLLRLRQRLTMQERKRKHRMQTLTIFVIILIHLVFWCLVCFTHGVHHACVGLVCYNSHRNPLAISYVHRPPNARYLAGKRVSAFSGATASLSHVF